MIELLAVLKGHEYADRIWHLSWNSDGKYLCTCGEDKIIRIWSVDYNINKFAVSCISTLEDGQSRTIRCCEWSPNSQYIASASFDGTIFIWQSLYNSNNKQWEKIASLEGHENEVKCVAWNNDSNKLATCGRDKKIWVWEILDGGEFECITVLDGHTQDIKFIIWHPIEPIFFSSSYDDTIRIWKDDGEDFYCLQILKGHNSTVWCLSLNSTGDELLSCCEDASIALWKRQKGHNSDDSEYEYECISVQNHVHDGPIYSIHRNSTNNLCASVGGDNALIISSITTIQNTDATYTASFTNVYTIENAHNNDINCVRWCIPRTDTGSIVNSYGNSILATCGDDGLIKIWKISDDVGKEMR